MPNALIHLAVAGILTLLGVQVCATEAQSNKTTKDEPMVVRYHLRPGLTDAHNAYQFELIKQTLEVTKEEYGNYSIEPYSLAPNAKRQAILISEGDLLNIHWASPGTPIATANVIPIPVDILQGLLGYRVCLVNKNAPSRFDSVKNLETLNNIKIGQGLDWADNAIYTYNQIRLTEGPNLDGLFNMLASQRFDCLALGAGEVQFLFEEQYRQYPFLAIESSVLLYYEFPTYLYVSKRHPKLAARVSLGLQKMQRSGEFERLYNRYFAKNLVPLNLDKRRIICLKSPYITDNNQCKKIIHLPQLN